MSTEQAVHHSTQDYVLSIDNGTQSVRAMLFDISGNLHGLSRIEIEPYVSAQPGWAEQEADYYWQAVGRPVSNSGNRSVLIKHRLKASASPLSAALLCMWISKGEPYVQPWCGWISVWPMSAHRYPNPWRSLFKLVGAASIVDYFRAQAEINWVAQHQPEIHAHTHKVLLLSGYLNYQLSGRFVDSVASCVGYLPFDYKKLRWAAKGDWKWHALAVRREQLPELIAPGELLGHVHAAASLHTGLPEGLPIIAAAADKACEVLGAGAVDESIACLSYGTTATINTTRSKYLEVTRLIPAYPAAIPQHFTTEVMIYRGFWMVSWFKREFGLREQQRAERLGVSVESLFEELIEQVPAGSMGLMLQPYWSPGVREPGLDAKGAIIGFGDVHTRAHIYRAILEGLAYGLRQGKEHIEKRSGVTIERLRVSGGGSQSDAVLQLTADVFGLPVERPHTIETSGLGAAIACMVGVGLQPDFTTAVQSMTRTAHVFLPNQHNHALYNQLYAQVYCKMYKRLQPLYQSIRRITGYPK